MNIEAVGLHYSRWIQAISLVGLWNIGFIGAGYARLPNASQLKSADCSDEISQVIDQLFHSLEKCHEAFEQKSDLLLVKVYQEFESTFQKLGTLVEPFLACQPLSSSLSNVVTQYMLYAAYYEVVLKKKNIPVSKMNKVPSKNKRFETLYSLIKAYVQVMNLPEDLTKNSEGFFKKMAEILQQTPSRENGLAIQKILQNFHVKQYYQVVVESHKGTLLSSKCETKDLKKTVVSKRKAKDFALQQSNSETLPENSFQGNAPIILDSAIGKARLGGDVKKKLSSNSAPFPSTPQELGAQGPVSSQPQSMNSPRLVSAPKCPEPFKDQFSAPKGPEPFKDQFSASKSPEPFKDQKEAQKMIQQVYSVLETHDLSNIEAYRDYPVESILLGLSFAALTNSELKKKYERIVQELEQALVTLGMQDQKNHHEILLKDLETLWTPKASVH